MTDIDIVAELRRLYEDSTTDGDRSWVHGDVVNERGCVLFSGRRCIEVGTIFTQEDADLIVAMHEALPALLDVIDTLRWYADRDHYNEDGIPGIESRFAPDGWLKDYGERARVAVALLKLLKRSDG